MRVIGYLRVSTAEQRESGAGLDAQRTAIEAEASRRGWKVEWIEDAGISAKDLRRPGIQRALALLADGEASALVTAKLDRLSRSLLDFAGLMDRARAEGWALVCLDLNVDTTTAAGEMVASVMASFAQFERKLIGQRTRDALAAKRAAGVRLGRPRSIPRHVRDRIVSERDAGKGWSAIAAGLNEDGVPTAGGGIRWHDTTVKRVVMQAASA